MKYMKLEHEVNLETISNARNMGKKKKKDSAAAIESLLLTLAETEFCNFSLFHCMELGN